jgi:type II secretory pathway pseudopilin PulG
MAACPSCGAEGTGAFCPNCGVNFATGKKKKKGLSGCAIVAIVLGALAVAAIPVILVIAAIAVPNLLNAIERGRQKRTMMDIRSVATAVESYGIDNNAYPEATSIDGLAPMLVPTYIKALPRTDAWEQPFRYEAYDLDPEVAGPDSYAVGSSAQGGDWEQAGLSDYEPGSTQRFSEDIVWRDGKFIRWPEGTQSH